MSEAARQAWPTALPGLHFEHWVHAVALVTLVKLDPAEHDRHWASTVALHQLVVYFPVEQIVQVCGAADPPAQNEPVRHPTYAFPFQYWPIGAALPPEEIRGQLLDPETEVVPEAHAVQMLDPALAAYVPALHGVHTVAEPFPYVPATHGVQPALVALGIQ